MLFFDLCHSYHQLLESLSRGVKVIVVGMQLGQLLLVHIYLFEKVTVFKVPHLEVLIGDFLVAGNIRVKARYQLFDLPAPLGDQGVLIFSLYFDSFGLD